MGKSLGAERNSWGLSRGKSTRDGGKEDKNMNELEAAAAATETALCGFMLLELYICLFIPYLDPGGPHRVVQ
jgi:hypothetical protein